jgi:hypothetical protein
VLRVFLFLLLGTVINVAVAWAFVIREALRTTRTLQGRPVEGLAWPRETPENWPPPTGAWNYAATGYLWKSMYSGLGATYTGELTTSFLTPCSLRADWMSSMSGRAYQMKDFTVTSDSTSGVPGQLKPLWMSVTSAGWPLFALQSHDVSPLQQSAGTRGAYRYVRFLSRDALVVSPSSGCDIVFPLAPLWPGFVAGAVLFASIAWLLACGPRASRRRWRTHRGLCPSCAYPLGITAVCPECGKPVKPRRAASP